MLTRILTYTLAFLDVSDELDALLVGLLLRLRVLHAIQFDSKVARADGVAQGLLLPPAYCRHELVPGSQFCVRLRLPARKLSLILLHLKQVHLDREFSIVERCILVRLDREAPIEDEVPIVALLQEDLVEERAQEGVVWFLRVPERAAILNV